MLTPNGQLRVDGTNTNTGKAYTTGSVITWKLDLTESVGKGWVQVDDGDKVAFTWTGRDGQDVYAALAFCHSGWKITALPIPTHVGSGCLS